MGSLNLDVIEELLQKSLQFIEPHLQLANTHAAHFITDNQWNLLPEKLQTDLSQQTYEELKTLPIRAHTEPIIGQKSSMNFEYKDHQLVNKLEYQSIAKNRCLDDTRDMDALQDFCFQARRYTIEGMAIHLTTDEFSKHITLGRTEKHCIGAHMGRKKCHEVEIMSEICAAAVKQSNCQLVVDFGSGKGYLGNQLVLNHKISVFGVDARLTNTRSAMKRSAVLNKQWSGIQRNVKLAEMGVKLTKREKKKLKYEVERGQNEVEETEDNTGAYNESQNKANMTNLPQSVENTAKYVPCTMFIDKNTNFIDLVKDHFPELCLEKKVFENESDLKSECENQCNKGTDSVCELQCQFNSLMLEVESDKREGGSEDLSCVKSKDDSNFPKTLTSQTVGYFHVDSPVQLSEAKSSQSESSAYKHEAGLGDRPCYGLTSNSNSPNPQNYLHIDSSAQLSVAKSSHSDSNYYEHEAGLGDLSFNGLTNNSDFPNPQNYLHVDRSAQQSETKFSNSNSSACQYIPTTSEQNNDGELKLFLTGLHTCGNLASSSLEIFVASMDIKGVCNVGCCYHLLDEKFCEEKRDATLQDPSGVCSSPDQCGFPMSQYLTDRGVYLGKTARNLACQSIHRVAYSEQLQGESFYPRALLEVLVRENCGGEDITWPSLRKLGDKATSTQHYLRLACDKMEISDKVSDDAIESCVKHYESYRHQLSAFFQFKTVLAPCIESLILLDRICYLLEQAMVKDVFLIKMFDPVTSPRCYGILAMK